MIINASKIKNIDFNRSRTYKSVFLGAITTLVILGTFPIFRAPVIADDLLVLSESISKLSERSNTLSVFGEYLKGYSNANHFLPVGGFLNIFQSWVIYNLESRYLDVLFYWQFFRSIWHVLSIGSFSFFTVSILNKSTRFNWNIFIPVYALYSLLFMSFTQIHGIWIHDPVVSYSFAGSGTAFFCFIYLGLTSHMIQTNQPKIKTTLATLIVGLLGLFNYEMFIVALIGAIILILMLRGLKNLNFNELKYFLPSVLLLSTYFVVEIVKRTLLEPAPYDGMQFGDLDKIFPNFVTGFYGSLPLIFIDLANQTVGIPNFEILTVSIFVGCFLLILATYLAGHRQLKLELSKVVSNRFHAFNVVTMFLWVSSTLLFSLSTKYQFDLGIILGRVYNFYSIGNLAFIGLLSLWFFQKSNKIQIFSVALVLVVGIYTSQLNYALTLKLKSNQIVQNYELLYKNYSDNQLSFDQRCELILSLRSSTLPEYYKNILIFSYNRAFFNKYNQINCETYH